MNNFNKLTPAETERLSILMEECGEVIQIIGKILRHGYESYNPYDEVRLTNRDMLEKELGDIFVATERMLESSDIDEHRITGHANIKRSKEQYLHHNNK